jgi:Ctr copper transporter family
MILSYFLMLIVMYYNVWLCFAVVGGATLGYFCFGWTKLQMIQQQCGHPETQHELEEQHKF